VLAFLLRSGPTSLRFLFRPKQNTVSRVQKWREMRAVGGKLAELGWRGRVRHYHHHLCHAASAFYASGFEDAACLTVDGNGEIAATTIHEAGPAGLRPLYRKDYPDSLGHYYATLTQYLGFQPMNDEYKVMGLAAFGKGEDVAPVQHALARALSVGGGGAYRLHEEFFQFHRGQDRMWSDGLERLLGPARAPGAAVERAHEKIALAAQRQLEDALLALSKKARELSPRAERLCLAGGVALNCVANERIVREAGWKDVFIPPCPHDSGSALGAAYLALAEARPGGRTPRLKSASLGRSLRGESAAAPAGRSWRREKLPEHALPGAVAALLEEGKVVAWAVGRSEFGPRALGNRSILADPRRLENKERLNRVIKRREPFRPFAPVVPVELADEIFDMSGFDSPFMLRTVPVRPSWAERIPAAIHVDGSARVQTLAREGNPPLYALLEAFRGRTGVPVLLNTSLNTAGEPIVNTAAEAFSIFERTEIDVLVLDGNVFRK
jgi:carbamoyltransferase